MTSANDALRVLREEEKRLLAEAESAAGARKRYNQSAEDKTKELRELEQRLRALQRNIMVVEAAAGPKEASPMKDLERQTAKAFAANADAPAGAGRSYFRTADGAASRPEMVVGADTARPGADHTVIVERAVGSSDVLPVASASDVVIAAESFVRAMAACCPELALTPISVVGNVNWPVRSFAIAHTKIQEALMWANRGYYQRC